MRYGYLIALAILCGAVLYYLAPPHRQAMDGARQWWYAWTLQAHTNLVPNQRGLNVAVLDAAGRPVASQVFDTYLTRESGFDRFVAALPADVLVLVAVRDEASQNLSPADVAALRSLGGTEALQGKYRWAYILVGRPGLAPGTGLERVSAGPLDVRLPRGTTIGRAPVPVGIRIRSDGYEGGNEASVHLDFALEPLWRWIQAALGRA